MKCFNCDTEMEKKIVNGPEEARMIQNIARGYADATITEKPDILTVDEVTDLLKVTSQTIYNMIKDKRLTAIKIGRECLRIIRIAFLFEVIE